MHNKRIVEWYTIFRAIRDALKEPISPDECVSEIFKLMKWAKFKPNLMRLARAQFQHHRDMGEKDPFYTDTIIPYITMLENKYGNRSLTFQTMMDAVGVVRLSQEQVNTLWKRQKLAPAFNPSIRNPLSVDVSDEYDENIIPYDEWYNLNGSKYENPELTYEIAVEGFKIRQSIYEWVGSTDDPNMEKLKEILNSPVEPNPEYSKDGYRMVVLTNGSSSGRYIGDKKLLDIEAQCFLIENKPIPDTYYLQKKFKIGNYLEGIDDCIYLEIPDNWEGADGVHIVVPDKDGKSREIYISKSDSQTILKGIVDALDLKMRNLPGIFTYNQDELVEAIVENDLQNKYLIITIDMDKFSDTIVRKYFLRLLHELGWSKRVINDLDTLYTTEIYDNVKDESLGTHDVILQGMYSVFMLMSVLNYTLQRFFLHKYRPIQDCYQLKFYNEYCNGVVGDDTLIVFMTDKASYDEIFEDIQEVFGTFGLVINTLKSDYINRGIGQGDFTKKHFDRHGIIDHLNVRNIDNQNIDEIIRNILGLHISRDQKFCMLSVLFSETAAREIMSLSILNGGLSDHQLTISDIIYFKNNLIRMHKLMQNEREYLEEERVLDYIISELNSKGYTLKDTILWWHIPKEERDIIELLSDEEINDRIKGYILNINRVGIHIDMNLLDKAVGYSPSTLQNTWKEERFHKNKSEAYYIWEEISKYNPQIAKRKIGNKGKYSSIYLPCITGKVDILYSSLWVANSDMDKMFTEITDIRNIEEYDKARYKYMSTYNYNLLYSLGFRYQRYQVANNLIVLISCDNCKTDSIWYRLHNVSTQSKWNPVSHVINIYNEYLSQYGIEVDESILWAFAWFTNEQERSTLGNVRLVKSRKE